MPVTIPATTARREFGDLIKRVFSGREHFIVEKDGLPVVAIISMAEYEELMTEREHSEMDKAQRLKQFREATRAVGEEMERRGLTEEEALEQLEETKQQTYQKHYGRNQQ